MRASAKDRHKQRQSVCVCVCVCVCTRACTLPRLVCSCVRVSSEALMISTPFCSFQPLTARVQKARVQKSAPTNSSPCCLQPFHQHTVNNRQNRSNPNKQETQVTHLPEDEELVDDLVFLEDVEDHVGALRRSKRHRICRTRLTTAGQV